MIVIFEDGVSKRQNNNKNTFSTKGVFILPRGFAKLFLQWGGGIWKSISNMPFWKTSFLTAHY